jgi:hypothetical protein
VQVLQQALETAQANAERMSENGTLVFNEARYVEVFKE